MSAQNRSERVIFRFAGCRDDPPQNLGHIFAFKDFGGSYGQSRFPMSTAITLCRRRAKATFEVRARGELDLTELRQQMKLGILPS